MDTANCEGSRGVLRVMEIRYVSVRPELIRQTQIILHEVTKSPLWQTDVLVMNVTRHTVF